jgi:ABC-2 type transport system permease protein
MTPLILLSKSSARQLAAKYFYVLQMGIQNTLVYRFNFLCRAVFNLVPLIAMIALWQTIYAGRGEEVSSYTITQMICYYLLVIIIDALTSVTEDDWQVAADIKECHISQFLVRPIDYLGYRLCLFLSGRLVFTLAAAGPVLAVLVWQ